MALLDAAQARDPAFDLSKLANKRVSISAMVSAFRRTMLQLSLIKIRVMDGWIVGCNLLVQYYMNLLYQSDECRQHNLPGRGICKSGC